MTTIILCGHQSCGKTTVAKAYSQTFGVDCIDTDEWMIQAFLKQNPTQKRSDLTPRILYQHLGVLRFRALEAHVIKHIQPIRATIIATGGGTLLHQDNLLHLKSLGCMIYLKMNRENIKQRWAQTNSPHHKMSLKMLNNDIDKREFIYQNASDKIIESDHFSISTIVEIIKWQNK